MAGREQWGSKIGVILAVAGSAVGLGNFLRFPAKATLNGGGAFMIPYFVALILLGIPLMWVEWTLGRKGGADGHGTAPGIFDSVGKRSIFKYLGTIGILGPFIILIYYIFIESWTLAYAWFSFTGQLFEAGNQDGMKQFLQGYQGIVANQYFSGIQVAYLFFHHNILYKLLLYLERSFGRNRKTLKNRNASPGNYRNFPCNTDTYT